MNNGQRERKPRIAAERRSASATPGAPGDRAIGSGRDGQHGHRAHGTRGSGSQLLRARGQDTQKRTRGKPPALAGGSVRFLYYAAQDEMHLLPASRIVSAHGRPGCDLRDGAARQGLDLRRRQPGDARGKGRAGGLEQIVGRAPGKKQVYVPERRGERNLLQGVRHSRDAVAEQDFLRTIRGKVHGVAMDEPTAHVDLLEIDRGKRIPRKSRAALLGESSRSISYLGKLSQDVEGGNVRQVRVRPRLRPGVRTEKEHRGFHRMRGIQRPYFHPVHGVPLPGNKVMNLEESCEPLLVEPHQRAQLLLRCGTYVRRGEILHPPSRSAPAT